MKLFNKMKLRGGVAVSLLAAILVVGCVKNPLGIDETGGDLNLSISARSVIGSSKDDQLVVSDLRVLAMQGDKVVFNKSTKDGGLTPSGSTEAGNSLFVLPLKQGEYKIAVVGNETQAMTTLLDAVETLEELSAITVAEEFTEANIPVYRELNVTTKHSTDDPTNGVVQIVGSTDWSAELEVPLERIQTRVSLFVRKNTGNGKTLVIQKAELAQVPQFVHLSPRSFDHSAYRTLTPYDNATGIAFDVNQEEEIDNYASYTEVFSEGNIFAENRMNDPSNAAQATTLKLQGTYGGKAVNYQYEINFNGTYTLLRNVHYKIYTTIKTNGDIESQDVVVRPELWNGELIDVDLLTPYLNVQELNLNLKLDNPAANHYHMHYWTNQPSTLVETKMKRLDDQFAGGVEEMDVSRVFNNLSGVGAVNNHFDTKVPGSTGYTGYLDIDIKAGYDFPNPTNQYRIVLSANGLRREITITIAKTSALNPTHIGYTPWIGTFHRWNQVGERVIAAVHHGAWSAKVMNDASNADNFVVITKSESTDGALGTDDPDDAENHKLLGLAEGGAETLHDATSTTGVVGKDAIYFRIGLKSKLASPTAAPRYARVELTTTSGVQYLYVRQGEADDYIYAPAGDPELALVTNVDKPVSAGSEPRLQARKISPYNLSVARPTAGGAALNSHYQFDDHEKAILTNYPTMAGWYFTWYFSGSTPYYNGDDANARLVNTKTRSYRKAYHPYNPIYHGGPEIQGFPNVVSGDAKRRQFLNYVVDRHNDPCPMGYEMMSSKEALHSLYQSYMAFTPTHSQSNQFIVQNRDVINYLWGYYADGYYDRRPTRSLNQISGDNYYRPFQLAGYNADVAYMGALFYNHDTDKNNSVFLPGAGIRTSSTAFDSPNSAGDLQNIGGRAVYFLKDNYYQTPTSKINNGVGVIELAGVPGNNTSYNVPTSTKYLFNFNFNGLGAHATPMRCVKKEYPTPAAAVVVFDWNGAIPSDATVVGTTGNQHLAPSGTTITFVAGDDFMPAAGATFTKGGTAVAFQGWNTRADGKGTLYNAGRAMTLPVGVSILYAQWL